ncbi:MAG: nitroreductase [Bacteroidaceae bacterium]|nr:nitroreductase [Bacteroidaceae bacterium]
MKTNEILENIRTRHSIRSYNEKQVSKEDLQMILEAGTYAPNGMGLRTWHFSAIQNAQKLEELNEQIKRAFTKSNNSFEKERGHDQSYCCYYHAPTLIIVSNEPTYWWSGMDCACAIENMYLAAHSLGIGACWINQLGITSNDPEVRKFISSLGVPDNHRVYGCLALGYAKENLPLKEKKIKEGIINIVE